MISLDVMDVMKKVGYRSNKRRISYICSSRFYAPILRDTDVVLSYNIGEVPFEGAVEPAPRDFCSPWPR